MKEKGRDISDGNDNDEYGRILTLRSDPRPVVTKDCNETTIAPSFISRNFGLIASLTSNKHEKKGHQQRNVDIKKQ